MGKILRMTDRVRFKIKDIEFTIAPLSTLHKSEISGATKSVGGEQVIDLVKSQFLYIKYGLKNVKGLKDYHGKDYELEFDGDCLSDNCVDEIFNIAQKDDFLNVAWQMFNGMPDKIIDQETGKEMKGVKIEVLGNESAE